MQQEGKGAGGSSKARVREAVVLPREKDPIERRSVDVALTEELTGRTRTTAGQASGRTRKT